MAIYKLNSEKAKNRGSRARKITGFTMIGVASLIFLLMTGIIPVLQKFFLGIFGVFGYVLCVLTIIIGLAVLNKRKYVMPKRYAIYLGLAVLCLLCVIQLIIVGGKYNADNTQMSFWQYWALNYSKKWTAGGFLLGFLTTCALYIANSVGAYLIFSLGCAIFVALLVDTLNKLKQEKTDNEPVSLQLKENKVESKEEKVLAEPEKQEEVNVVLDGHLKEEKKEPQGPLSAKQMLGLDHKRNYAYEYHNKQGAPAAETAAPVAPKVEPAKPTNLKDYILTPPEVDIDEFFKNIRSRGNAPAKEEVSQNVSALKEEKPMQEMHETYAQPTIQVQANFFEQQNKVEKKPAEDEFVPENNQFSRPLEEIDSSEFVEQADDILRSVVEEEKQNNPEVYESSEPKVEENFDRRENVDRNQGFERRDNFERRDVSAERNMIDRLPERNNSGAFERRNLDRNDRMMNQDDRDARNQFNRELDTIAARNGTLARENGPIPEEEPEEIVPYVYTKPSLDMITTQSVDLSTLNTDVAEKRVALENALEMFNIAAKVQGVVIGPAVTRYELEMPQGVPVSKIKSHVDDIAYALAAEGSIRVEAPVPGRSVVGIEVPNSKIATISLKDILSSREFQDAHSPLTFAVGKDITGRVICANLQKFPHLLVAGTTGSGKSVCLNSIILSIIYKASPEDVRIMLVDPKRVEFASYEGLPHLIMPKILCDSQKAINGLAWAIEEMERRFKMLELARVKNIDEFNQTPDVLNGKVKKMPFIVLIVDELADLMMTGKKDVEEKIVRIAQKSRAAGIHMVLATQRPSTDVVTGLIKGNLPSKISFAVSSVTDSMVVLDRPGADKLLGKGDMLYFPLGAKDPVRVQGCFISTPEINNILDFVRDNNETIYDKDIENRINNPNANIGDADNDRSEEIDPLFKQALKACIDANVASGTMLRRKFAIGFSRAGRLLDQMEAAGHISSQDGAKPRTVYITEEEFRDLYGDDEE